VTGHRPRGTRLPWRRILTAVAIVLAAAWTTGFLVGLIVRLLS
jgi:hypothetical protein